MFCGFQITFQTVFLGSLTPNSNHCTQHTCILHDLKHIEGTINFFSRAIRVIQCYVGYVVCFRMVRTTTGESKQLVELNDISLKRTFWMLCRLLNTYNGKSVINVKRILRTKN